jgi:hypothetical protein
VGGGFYNRGTVNLQNGTLSSNSADFGGGFFNAFTGTVVVTDSTLFGNLATTNGGGFFSSGTVRITNSTLFGNISGNSGGGFQTVGGTVNVINSTFSGNTASSGGGFYNTGVATVRVINSTFSGNTVSVNGGGFYNTGSGTVQVTNSTLSGNAAAGGGGLFNFIGTVTLNNSIVANSTSGGDCSNSATVNGSRNLIGDGSCASVATFTGNPQLGTLQNNGGSTQTILPNSGSPVIDAGDNTLAVDADGATLTTDQRGAGFPRIGGVAVDLGAVELSAPTVSIAATDPNAAEVGADTGTFTITRTGVTTSALDVTVTISGTATNGTDYTTISTTVTIPANAASVDVTITPTDDALVEAAETVTLTLTDGAAYDLGATTSATVTITSDDILPVVSIAATDPNAAEAGADTGTFTITRTGVTINALDVTVTISGTATNGTDYTTISTTVTIPASAASVDVTITPTDDALVEAAETVILTLTDGAAYDLGATTSATVTITSDDVLPVVSINDVSSIEGDAGTTDYTFTVSLTIPAGIGGVTFDIATADNTATAADTDYIANSLTGQSIPAGSSSYTFTVTVNGDATIESTETFFVNITNITGATAGDTQGQGTITDDDVAGVSVTQTGGTTNTTEAGATDTLAVVLTRRPLSDVVITVTSGNTAEVTADPAGLTFTPTTWDTAQTVTVTGIDDAVVDGDQTVTITIAVDDALSNDAFDTVLDQQVTVTNADNDVVALAVVSISATDPNAAEAGVDAGTFVVSRTGATTGALDVIYTIGGTATNGTDYTPNLTGTVTIPDGQTSVAITINPVNDAATESGETVVLTLQADATYTLGTDNDSAAPAATAATQPAPPLCSLIGGGTNRIIRADVPGGLNANVFCRILVENRVYVQNAAEVGDGTLVNAGIIQAVDVFGFTGGGVQVADFNLPITICLQGSGRIFFRDATNAPRITVQLAVSSNNGYTCSSIPNAGTVILVP